MMFPSISAVARVLDAASSRLLSERWRFPRGDREGRLRRFACSRVRRHEVLPLRVTLLD